MVALIALYHRHHLQWQHSQPTMGDKDKEEELLLLLCHGLLHCCVLLLHMPCMACAIAACAVLLAAACVAALLLALSMIACRPWRKCAPVRGSADCAGCCGGACCAPWAELCAAASAAFAWPLLGEPSGWAGTASTLSDVSRACPA